MYNTQFIYFFIFFTLCTGFGKKNKLIAFVMADCVCPVFPGIPIIGPFFRCTAHSKLHNRIFTFSIRFRTGNIQFMIVYIHSIGMIQTSFLSRYYLISQSFYALRTACVILKFPNGCCALTRFFIFSICTGFYTIQLLVILIKC